MSFALRFRETPGNLRLGVPWFLGVGGVSQMTCKSLQITANQTLIFSGIYQQITANHMQIKTLVFVVLASFANHCKSCDLQ